MLCLDLPHLKVKFKIVKEFTFRSQKKDGGGPRMRAQENRGPEGYRGWEVWIRERIKIGEFSFFVRGSPCLSQILPGFESQGRGNMWLEFVVSSHP